ncbi:SDR family NAD(P)-dependent oxidoreductase [Deinococcus cellulosilyticus]|uniref:Oxidoreductase n=1 Tax=Deinococcus cellulosilyticus (strain DSM 18568 / NBRC 106333 / KACC 11606 / 5516J-15) TaxID=1223518 RepID=A0A511N4Q3_DEIC1|nr:SDR family NAD(P)-dependent oxidoreductase [Deinococcus cellulosilyticus]GEM47448.1 oxidoreductase [Deinococcus cellulosilyticus NBRC 106333 = KACC 11606]
MELTGKKIVVTGAASGIGRALLTLLCEQDVQVVAVDLTAVQPTDFPAPHKILPLVIDLAGKGTTEHILQQAVERMGRVDVFFANAGFAYYETLENPDQDHLERIFQVNVYAAIDAALGMQALNRQKPYRVVITSSAMAYIPLPKYALYSATKAALHAFADSYRWQLSDPRSLVLVYPIATQTGFFGKASARTPLPYPSQTPEEVARAILKGIERNETSIFPSEVFWLGLKLKAVLPFLHRFIQWREQVRR